ncbi:restriction endonuclease subunit S [Spiroplasma platyhelix]|uniref:Type I restriction modification DNA specificity domain-containing protein n=1 Tax=Spiroplasma platyhelix PALS-1 TaxID=1276218 RepID=A0A846TX00_9MOLU|nr:restriction endonuclease subunit S [Spiroplasma platyhelix]MBE4704208.1 hypothetical protein [Spiroplasma platyhelix PALS-1]NKE38581.1 hypothetical protein [Spiroplasma platyhelix PALS-1]
MAIKLKELYKDNPEYGAPLPALSLGKYKYVRQTDIKNKIFNTFVNSGPLLKKDDILISRVGSNAGETYIHDTEEKCVFAGFLVRYHFDDLKLKNKYFYYWTKTSKYKNQVKKMITGSGQPQFNPPVVSELMIFIPKIETQQQIIDIIEPIELIETKLAKIKNKLIKLLIDLYSTNVKIQNSFNSRIKILNSSYEGQNNYFATNAIGELEIDYNKIIPLTGKIPSRANISPTNDSFIFSKLDGENKLFYFKERPKEVFSTGFFNFKTEYHDHILGFMLSDKFKLQKEQYATGTTMRSINNQSLKLIQLNEPKYKSNNITIMLYDIEKTSNKSKELKSKLINLLIK